MTPTTEAGRALLAEIGDSIADGGGLHVSEDDIRAIEAEAEHRGYLRANDCDHSECIEARAALLAELEAGVEGLECPQGDDPHGYYWGVFERNGYEAALIAVLDLIRKAGKP